MNLSFPIKMYTPGQYGNFKIVDGEWKEANVPELCKHI